MPCCVISDQGSNLIFSSVARCCAILGVRRLHFLTYTPHLNSVLERQHSTLHILIAKLINPQQSDWHLKCFVAAFVVNSHIHTALNETPLFLATMRDQPWPTLSMFYEETPSTSLSPTPDRISALYAESRSMYMKIMERHESASQIRARYQAKRARPRPITLGDKCFLKINVTPLHFTRKFSPKFEGVFGVTKILGKCIVEITKLFPVNSKDAIPKTVHISKLKLAPNVFTPCW